MKLNKRIRERIKGRLPGREAVRQNLKLLNAGTDGVKEEELYYLEKLSLLLKILAAGLGMTVLAAVIALRNHKLTEERFLPRQQRAYRQELVVTPEDGERQELDILVEPQKLTQKESRDLLNRTVEEMEAYILGDNASLEEVRSDLKLIRKVEGLPITIE